MSQHKHNRIFIIGHPGAGKALLAKTLAEKLGWKFIDADLGLEFHIGRTVKEILGRGEDEFYHCQSEILTEQIKKENIVVTTDASIICNEKLRQLLSTEFVVYLQVSTSIQMERTSRNPAPLLLVTDMKIFLDKLHHERDDLYSESANVTINSDDSALEEHVSSIIKIISNDQFIGVTNKQVQIDERDLILFHKKAHTPTRISDQQAICIKLLAQGKTSKEIAKEINISYRTVEGHIANAMELLGCASSKELIALYHDKH
ncbi:MAG: shikimate kinase [Gammaproteobacteria bacterium]|nr:shikimate kinase [Gammaproteobacteria bacterium]MCW5583429.1 shikimate kinase [Gammaproteobacteria bacterium]